MSTQPAAKRSVIIIGAGIAGLSAGVYAQKNGYHSQIFELHNLPGGLMTAWKRKGYTIDGCIHWLTGSRPGSSFYSQWEDIGLIQDRAIIDPEVFMRYEGKDGKVFNFYTDIDRLEQHMLELAPEDSKPIRAFCNATHRMVKMQAAGEGPQPRGLGKVFAFLRSLPSLLSALPALRKYGTMDLGTFAAQFKNPFLREVWLKIWPPEMSAAALVFTLAGLHDKQCGYPIGGSLPMALAVEKRYCELGGEIHYGSRVEKILTEPAPDGKGERAVGIRLVDGREFRAETVISAADGHATLWNMLEGRYLTDAIRKIYDEFKIFPPILLIGLGVKRTFPELPALTGGFSMPLEKPIEIAGESIDRLDAMVYNFDPTLAPDGKTVLTVMVPTSYTYWKDLSEEPERYEAEKTRIGIEMIKGFSARFPGLEQQVEMADVATPMTFEHFTGNWQGSFEGFLPTPKTMMTKIPKELPGLQNFYMAGQWVQAGGGLPSGIMTGREVIASMCKRDGSKFN